MKLVHFLLSIPFIITPFLITDKFIDSTLLIKKISIFILFAFISSIFYQYKFAQNKLNIKTINIIKYLILYILFQICISFFISTNLSESFWEILYLFGWITIYVFIISYINNEQFEKIIISTAIIGGLLSLLIYNDLLNIISLNIPTAGKLSSTFGYKNYFAQYLCFVIPASLCSIYLVEKPHMKIIMILLTIISTGALLITRCRAAWLAIFIAIIIFIILNKDSLIYNAKNILNHKIQALSIGTIIVVFSIIILKPIDIKKGIWIGDKSTIKETLMSIKDINKKSAWGDRIDLYKSSVDMIKGNPLFGVGLGNWKVLYPGYSSNDFIIDNEKHKVMLRPHNDLLWITAETGLIGLVLFIFFIMFHIKILIKKLKHNKNKKYYINLFCLLALSAIFIESLLDFPKERVMPNLYVWVILGYIISSNQVKTKHITFMPVIFAVIFSSTAFMVFNDMQSHTYSQKIKEQKNNNQFKQMKESCIKAQQNLRNINQEATPINYHLGIAYYYLGDFKSANSCIDQGLEISPYHIGLLSKKMEFYIRKKQFEKAYQTMRFMKSIYPKLYSPQIKLIKACIKTNNIELAKLIIENINVQNNLKVKREVNKLKHIIYQ